MREDEVQGIIKNWFECQGFDVKEGIKMSGGNKIDLVASSIAEKWFIEAKGDYDNYLSQYTTNFDTGIGQLVKSISKINKTLKYAICIPFSRTENGRKLSYRTILPKYSRSVVFEKLGIYLILVRDDESIEIVKPSEVNLYLSNIDPKAKI